VVLAAGAWSDQVEVQVGRERAVLPKSPPVRGHLVAFEEHMGLCDSIVRHGHTYLLRRAHDLVIGGASTEHVGFDRTINGAIAAEIARKAGEVIPQLRDCSYMTWNGFRPGSLSGEPVMGRVANAPVWLAYGHYRNGILLAPGTARGMARDILASDPMPASSQKGWFSPTARQR
jgi:glycine oxidase